MSSQYGEEAAILDHFGSSVGRFLDIGAFDGVTFSNTQALAERGWRGVLVEPAPVAFRWLMHHYAGNGQVCLVNAAVVANQQARDRRVREFYVNGPIDGAGADALSSLLHSHVEKFPRHPFRKIWTPVISVSELLGEFGRRFEFINIDVEGLNIDVLDGLVEEDVSVDMICIELDPASAKDAMVVGASMLGMTKSEVIGGNLLTWK